ncbi:MAG TPA: hypothetical protein VGD65_02780 [Chryseosolibacter sp.]
MPLAFTSITFSPAFVTFSFASHQEGKLYLKRENYASHQRHHRPAIGVNIVTHRIKPRSTPLSSVFMQTRTQTDTTTKAIAIEDLRKYLGEYVLETATEDFRVPGLY